MQIKIIRVGQQRILYDADSPLHNIAASASTETTSVVSPAQSATISLQNISLWFEPEFWREQGLLRGTAVGRGNAWFVGPSAEPWVLRHYRRGGLVGKLLSDQYLRLGLKRSRAWQEFALLAQLHEAGLPVPRPVAAKIQQRWWVQRMDLLTEQLPAAHTLADSLLATPLSAEVWQSVGRCIRRFHNAGVFHADLNARNILLGEQQVFVIDFDRGEIRAKGGWMQQNLQRLRRSLDKISNQAAAKDERFYFAEPDWQALERGYQSSKL